MKHQFDRFQILKKLGEGVFGAVYLAKGVVKNKERLVAIKVLHENANPEAKENLYKEYEFLKQIRHRCIVRVFEYFPQHHAIVMEYVSGIELRKIIQKLNIISEKIFVDTAVEIGCELADALYCAYTTTGYNGYPLQLVHRDLKPENIIMTTAGAIKILDFGLARVHNDFYVKENQNNIKGTPIYMAPEQVLKLPLDHRTDLFAVGLVLYELLMGEPAYRIPYDEKDPLAIIFEDIKLGKFNFDIDRLKRMLPKIGPTIARLLEHDPDLRYPHGQDVLLALQQQLPQSSQHSYIEEFAKYYFSQVDVEEKEKIEGLIRQPKSKFQVIESFVSKKHTTRADKKVKEVRNTNQISSFRTDDGVHMSKKPKPPVGGGASRSSQEARSPNDSGMLDFVPSTGSFEDEDSATQFFTISAPEQNTSSEQNARLSSPNDAFSGMNSGGYGSGGMGSGGMGSGGMGPGGIGPGGMGPGGMGPGGMGPGGMGPGGMGPGGIGPGGMGPGGIGPGGMGPGGMGPGGIGPGGMGPGGIGPGGMGPGGIASNTPVVGNHSTDFQPNEVGMKSNRIWIIFTSVFVLLLFTIAAVLYYNLRGDGKERKEIATKVDVPQTVIKTVVEVETQEPIETKTVTRTRTRTRATKTTRKTTTTVQKPTPAQKGTLTVKIKGDATRVGISGCARGRKNVSGNRVSFSNVPLEKCTLKFEPSGLFTTVKGGQKTVTCSISGNKVICR